MTIKRSTRHWEKKVEGALDACLLELVVGRNDIVAVRLECRLQTL